MPSRPLDKERLNNQLRRLEEYLDHLEEIRSKGKEQFLNSDLLQAATERYLQISIETLLNIGNHIVAAKGLKLPGEYADIFRALAEAGVLKYSKRRGQKSEVRDAIEFGKRS